MSKVKIKTSRQKIANILLSIGCVNINFKNKATGKIVGQGYQRLSIVNSEGKVVRIPEILREPLDFYQEVET